MVNTIGVVFLILTAFITILSLMVRSSTYNGIELALAGRADELLNWLSAGSATSSSFTGIVRDYIETFPDKNNMEIMALDQQGRVFITSTGFEPDQDQEMPYYQEALQSQGDSGKWMGKLNTGEKVMAITRVVRDDSGNLLGSIRYMVSLERADQQTTLIIFGAHRPGDVHHAAAHLLWGVLHPVHRGAGAAGERQRPENCPGGLCRAH